jgi:hypothetical protein
VKPPLSEKPDQPAEKEPLSFADRDGRTQFKWALKYFFTGAFAAIIAIRVIWFADLLLPTPFVLFLQGYVLVGMLVCEWDKHHAVKIDGRWNLKGWLTQIYWWFWWPYFAWKTIKNRMKKFW